MDLDRLLVPVLGVDTVEEPAGGHQSRVFRATDGNGVPMVVKVFDAALVDRVELDARLDVTDALADLDPQVCRPVEIDGRWLFNLDSADGDQYYVACFEFAHGNEPEVSRSDHVTRMGAALAQLHTSMSQLPAMSLPVVAALRATPVDDVAAGGSLQLLHGDFNTSNLRVSGGALRIFDFDDCGYGPPAFDVANALYMVLFDAVIHRSIETYQRFRRSFVQAYVDASGSPLPDGTLDRFIDLRVRALGAWLDDLDHAPIGIRTASQEWLTTLRSFVAGQQPADG